MAVLLKIESRRESHPVRECHTCNTNWPVSLDYCGNCGAHLDAVRKTEHLTWYLPKQEFSAYKKQKRDGGVHEAAVITYAVCARSGEESTLPEELLQCAANQFFDGGALLTRGPSDHLTACFLDRDPLRASIHAVQCALETRKEITGNKTRIFAGINTGPVLLPDNMFNKEGKFPWKIEGDVILFSETVAFSLHSGMILISPSTFRLVRSYYQCYGTRPVDLWKKGREFPKVIYVVKGLRTPTSWKHDLEHGGEPLVGREKELHLLYEWWEKTIQMGRTSGGPVHLIGDAGSGKSRLLSEFLKKVQRKYPGITMIKLAGFNYGSRPGLLLKEFVDQCKAHGILPTENEGRSDDQAPNRPEEGEAVFGRLCAWDCSELFRRAAYRAPLLIVLDDLHWADRDSVTALARVFSILPAGVMLILSYRPSGTVLGRLLATGNEKYILLSPLHEKEAADLIRIQTKKGVPLPGSVWRKICEKSNGNPLYIKEATALLLSVSKNEQRRLHLPDSLAELLVTRIRKWGEQELAGLRAELNIPGTWSSRYKRLSRIETRIDDWLDRLETQNYLERRDLARCLMEMEHFRSMLVEFCLIAGLPPPRDTRLQQALFRLYGGSFAEHFQYLEELAELPDQRFQAASQAVKVGRLAMDMGALSAAVRFFILAEKVLPPDYPLRPQLLEDEGDVHFRKGSVKEAVKRYEKLLNDAQLSDMKREEIVLKLFAARLLTGRMDGDAPPFRTGKKGSPWGNILMAAAGLGSGNTAKALASIGDAKKSPSRWEALSCAWLMEALVWSKAGEQKRALYCCERSASIMRMGGNSLLSLGLYCVLALVTEGQYHKRSRGTYRSISKKMEMHALLRIVRVRFSGFTRNKEGKQC